MTEQIVIKLLKEMIEHGADIHHSGVYCMRLHCDSCPINKYRHDTHLNATCAVLEKNMNNVVPFSKAIIKIKQTYPEYFI